MSSSIPKRIIQTGRTHELPLRQRAAVKSLRLLNPDFEYMFFDDLGVEKFFVQEFPQYKGVLDLFRFRIQRYDFFRYLAVYRYGGFYFDTDVFFASSLSCLLEYSSVFSFEDLTLSRFMRKHHGMDWAIGNYAFGSEAGHPFLRAVIDNCVRAQCDPNWLEPMMEGVPRVSQNEFHIFNTTGPLLLCRTLAENPDLANSIKILFPDDVCEPKNWHNFGDIGFHLMDGSWREESNSIWERLARRLELRVFKQYLKQSRKIGKVRQVVFNGEK